MGEVVGKVAKEVQFPWDQYQQMHPHILVEGMLVILRG